ncbi:outer membrane protein assembly factor BamE (lipoprotein component of BamABCDE complex) [Rossellomorea marisflavi]
MNRFRTIPLLMAALIILSGCRVEWSSSISKVEEEEKGFTLDLFSNLEKGMTYPEVVDVIGQPGIPEGEEDNGENDSVYRWEEDEKMVVISFQRGRLTMKEQFGL